VRYDQAEVPLSPALEAFLNAGEPPVVISIGSAMRTGRRYFEAALQACVMLNQRALLLARSGDQIPESLPPNAHHEPYAAFSQVFPRCRAVIHHGGIGTAAQALAAGVPHLVMPLSFDQFDTAERLKKLGVARSVPAKKFTTNAARTALDSLLNDTTASSKCKELKLKMQADALPSALIHLESLIGRDTSPSLKPSSKT
jgi:UDP:flavonoid glycosyltransferase YjiC (YdhE family)